VQAGEVTAANALVKLLRLQQITGGWIRTDAGKRSRSTRRRRICSATCLRILLPRSRSLSSCRFHKDLEAVSRVADETGRRCLEISGRIDDLKRWQAGEAPVLRPD